MSPALQVIRMIIALSSHRSNFALNNESYWMHMIQNVTEFSVATSVLEDSARAQSQNVCLEKK
jgi:hypothetical protein